MSSFLYGSSSLSFLQIIRTAIKSWMGSKFVVIRLGSVELAVLEFLEKIPYTYKGRNVVSTLVPSFLGGSSSFLSVTRTTTKAWMSLNFGQIPPPTTE